MKNTVRLSFDVPIEEHIRYKTECVKSQIAIKEFLHQLIMLGMKEYEKTKFNQKMEKSLKQAKEGKIRSVSSDELDQWEKELEDEAE